jgi:transposase
MVRGMRYIPDIKISDKDRGLIEDYARSGIIGARVALALDAGCTPSQAARRVEVTLPAVSWWLRRFEALGVVEALHAGRGRPRGARTETVRIHLAPTKTRHRRTRMRRRWPTPEEAAARIEAAFARARIGRQRDIVVCLRPAGRRDGYVPEAVALLLGASRVLSRAHGAEWSRWGAAVLREYQRLAEAMSETARGRKP